MKNMCNLSLGGGDLLTLHLIKCNEFVDLL